MSDVGYPAGPVPATGVPPVPAAWRRDDRIACHLAQHRCLLYAGHCRQHRRVWGDLLPIEQYRNGGFPRHSADTETIPLTVEYVNTELLDHLTTTTTEAK